MVGKNTEVGKIVADLVGKEYKLGKTDCFSIIKALYMDKFPQSWKGFTCDNYTNLISSPEEGSGKLVSFIKEFFSKKDYPAPGRIVIIEKINLVGVCVGTTNFVTSLIDKGVVVLPLKMFKHLSFWGLDG